MVELETLIAELHHLAVTRSQPAPLAAEDLAQCATLTTLPRYSNGLPGLVRLLADLQAAIATVLDDEVDRSIARAHFRLEHGHLQYMARHRALKDDGSDDTTKTRRQAVTLIEPRIAFYLFQQGIEWEQPYQKLDYGFRGIEHDWTLTVDPSDPRIETLTQRAKARAVRPGQRFYVFSGENDGPERDEISMASQDPNHVLVGDDGFVLLERGQPNGEFLVVVYLGRDYTTGEEVETGIKRQGKMESMPVDSGIFAGTPSNVDTLRLTADVPLALAPVMTLYDRVAHNWGVPEPIEIHRTDDSPVVYEVKPEVGHQYEITWIYSG